jgi:hypothetical protein
MFISKNSIFSKYDAKISRRIPFQNDLDQFKFFFTFLTYLFVSVVQVIKIFFKA